ncbi:MAG: type II toxin-antitoxin system RelB/DinJ family antitoxin [Roseburia sp.]
MAQATFSIRMDEGLKKQFDSLCSDFGMNATTAFNIFAKAVVRERKIPFEISAPSDTTRDDAISAFWEMRKIAEVNGLQDMTLDDINAEIEAARSGK